MQKGAITVRKESPSVRHLAIELDPAFPIHTPHPDRLHSPAIKPASQLHWHDTLEIGVCRRGKGLFFIGRRVFPFRAGDISVIMPGVIHIAQSDPDDVSGWQFIDLDPAALLRDSCLPDRLSFSGLIRPDENPDIPALVNLLSQELSRGDALAYASGRALTALLCVQLIRHAEQCGAQETGSEAPGDVAAAVVYISRHYAQNLTIAELAAQCSRSVTAFRRAFEQAMGTTPFEFLYTVRVRAAMNLLCGSEMSVSEIAAHVGYQTLSSFNRHFLRIAGESPSAFRRRCGK